MSGEMDIPTSPYARVPGGSIFLEQVKATVVLARLMALYQLFKRATRKARLSTGSSPTDAQSTIATQT